MPTGVRLARTSDVDHITAVQVHTWERLYGPLLRAAGVAVDAAALAEQWGSAILQPPHHHAGVLVATSDEEIVGFAAIGPSFDPDLGQGYGEIHALTVHPDRLHCGHGSRLMAACVDHLRSFGYRWLATWTLLDDEPRRAFWQSAGWRPDSARRVLDNHDSIGPEPSGTVTEIRLVVALVDDMNADEGDPDDVRM
jgi:GNAT superfamily N-acetyltransferase